MQASTIQLLRLHFSFFLLPVFLFALSQAKQVDPTSAIISFIVWHLLVYPSSNGYNSYMDRDKSPIGGLRHPLQPTRELFRLTMALDLIAVLLSIIVSWWFALGILIYIGVSRAYSYRGIRLKKYPVTGFLTVFIFQGAHVYYFSLHAVEMTNPLQVSWLPMLVASLLIGALYPLTQVYQHREDAADGVTTISMKLGSKGSFIFSMILFLSATALMFFNLQDRGQEESFFYFLLIMLPVVLFFLYWMVRVWKDESAADFANSTRMNIIATTCTTAFFLLLNFMKN